SSETFLSEFVDSIRTGVADAFKRRYRGVDVLLVDDIQFFEGKKETLEEFFHTFNALHETGRHLVLSTDRRPTHCPPLDNPPRTARAMAGSLAPPAVHSPPPHRTHSALRPPPPPPPCARRRRTPTPPTPPPPCSSTSRRTSPPTPPTPKVP